MKFDKMLQYQKIDQEVNSLKAEISRSEEWQKYQNSQAKLSEATNSINSLTTEANNLLKSYEAMKSKMEALRSEVAEFNGILEDVQDVGEADYYLKLINSLADKLTALEKEANGVASRIDQINNSYSKTWAQGVKATQVSKVAKNEYNDYLAGYKGKFDELQAKLNAVAKDIPQEELKTYLELKKSKKLPVYVEYDAEHKVCGRCRMEVPSDVRSKLKSAGDYAECPNCRRIMFVPEGK